MAYVIFEITSGLLKLIETKEELELYPAKFGLTRKILERAVMIRKLEHERDKLSTQLEKVQEGASQAKKVAKENESQASAAADKCKQLEGRGSEFWVLESIDISSSRHFRKRRYTQ